MAALLQKLPITDAPTTVTLPSGGSVAVRHDQIVVWVSITRPGLASCPPTAPRFPAILDTGFNNTFLIGEQQLYDWAGMRVGELSWIRKLLVEGRTVPMYDLDIWLFPNRPYSRDPLPGKPPIRVELEAGIAVWPAAIPGSRRLPLLGLAALRQARLQLHIDGKNGLVTLAHSHWWSSFGLVR